MHSYFVSYILTHMKTLLIIPVTLLLTSCGLFTRNVEVTANSDDPIVIHPNPPDQVSLREVEWVVLNRERLEELLSENPNQEIVLFALSAKGYENLSLNMQELLRYIQDQKNIILYYRRAFPANPPTE